MINFVTIKVLMTLMDGRVHSSKDLAQNNEVSTKTIQRAIQSLESGGVFIESKQGKNGGYYLAKNNIPQLTSLDPDELGELISLCSFKSSIMPSSTQISSLSQAIYNSMPATKTKAALVSSGKLIVDHLPWGEKMLESKEIESVYKACSSNLAIEFYYKKSNQDNPIKRKIFPYCVTLKNGAWYTYGEDESSHEMRLFKISRMNEIVVTNQKFVPNPEIDTTTKPWNNLESFDNVCILAKIKKSYLKELEGWLDIVSKTPDKSYYIISAKAKNNDTLCYKLIENKNNIQIISPQSVIEKLVNMCESTLNLYNNSLSLIQ